MRRLQAAPSHFPRTPPLLHLFVPPAACKKTCAILKKDSTEGFTNSKRRALVNKYPLFVAWYCAVRLELGLKAVAVPYFGASGYVGVFEWSPTGGMVHLHYILWKRHAPRFDVRAENLEAHAEKQRKAGLLSNKIQECKIEDVVDFFAQYVTEWNVNYDDNGEASVNHVPERVHAGVQHISSHTNEEMLELLEDTQEEARHEYYAKLVRSEHHHDFHYPHPTGPPNPSQPCARLLKGTKDRWYCANGYPRDTVAQPCEQSIAQDEMRKDLWRCHLCRNYPLMNSHMPPVSFFNQGNTDGQPVVTKQQAEMYLCKYCAKKKENYGARATLFDVIDDMESKNKAAACKTGDPWQATLGSKMHKAFMSEIGDEMCQAEVAHHANKCPEYFCSRPVKHVHIYKKALGIGRNQQNHDEEDEYVPWSSGDEDWAKSYEKGGANAGKHRARRITKKSDVELYESRTDLEFWRYSSEVGWERSSELSSALPQEDTPEAQVSKASLFDFFRLVQYHGGKYPYLSWHEEHKRPILIMSPVIKLAEGPDFPFNARWALMQYYHWYNRKQFLDASDEEVRVFFRHTAS